MKITNRVYNFFVTPPGNNGKPIAFESNLMVDANLARTLIDDNAKKQAAKTGKHVIVPAGKLLHVCFDAESKMLYVVNRKEVDSNNYESMLASAKVLITKKFGGFSSVPIHGSPFDTIRYRKLKNYSQVMSDLKEKYGTVVELPIIEANLSKMPTTAKTIEKELASGGFSDRGGLIGSQDQMVTFLDESDSKEKNIVLTQKTPFILINTSPEYNMTFSTAEWIVASSYRRYYINQGNSDEGSDIYTTKSYLYSGWSFEEICSVALRDVKSFPELMVKMSRLIRSANLLVAEGNKNLIAIPYFLSFKIDPDTFPINIKSIMDKEGRVLISKQLEYFRILDYNVDTHQILIETPTYISENVCYSVLKAESAPFIGIYNPYFNTIDVKSSHESVKDLDENPQQKAKIVAVTKYRSNLNEEKRKTLSLREGPQARGDWKNNPGVYNVKMLSDYPRVCKYLKEMCQRLGYQFIDMPVIVGDMLPIGGPTFTGGYADAAEFVKNNIEIPYEIVKGLFVSPPAIFIDAYRYPNYDEHSSIIIHEYRHHVFYSQNPEYTKTYENLGGGYGKTELETFSKWKKYFQDPSELQSHYEEIEYDLRKGLSVDEIVRSKVGGVITLENRPVALKFKEMVDEVAAKIEKEEEANENPERTS